MVSEGHNYVEVTTVYPLKVVLLMANMAARRKNEEVINDFRLMTVASRGNKKAVAKVEKQFDGN